MIATDADVKSAGPGKPVEFECTHVGVGACGKTQGNGACLYCGNKISRSADFTDICKKREQVFFAKGQIRFRG